MTFFEVASGRAPLILAVGAHPDDIEIGCGGTLLALAARGARIHGLVLTGTDERRAEAEAAAVVFGAEPPVFGGFTDARLPESWSAVKDALHTFARQHPDSDAVLVPSAFDAHQDHRLLGELAPTVWRGPLLLHYEIPKWDGDLGRPNAYVPLSDELVHRKVALLNDCYPSQHAHHWWDDELFLSLPRLRGMEAGARYAEAFTVTKLTIGLG